MDFICSINTESFQKILTHMMVEYFVQSRSYFFLFTNGELRNWYIFTPCETVLMMPLSLSKKSSWSHLIKGSKQITLIDATKTQDYSSHGQLNRILFVTSISRRFMDKGRQDMMYFVQFQFQGGLQMKRFRSVFLRDKIFLLFCNHKSKPTNAKQQ